MDWQYRILKNQYNKDQCFDYSQCPPRLVCKDCYLSYTNTGSGLQCSDCRDEHHHPVEEGQTIEKVTNKYGHTDYVLKENGEYVRFDNGDLMPVCPQCKCHMMPNRGNGCLCNTCGLEMLLDSTLDYHSGLF